MQSSQCCDKRLENQERIPGYAGSCDVISVSVILNDVFSGRRVSSAAATTFVFPLEYV